MYIYMIIYKHQGVYWPQVVQSESMTYDEMVIWAKHHLGETTVVSKLDVISLVEFSSQLEKIGKFSIAD